MKGAESIQVLESAKKTCDETLRKCLQVVEVRSTCEDDGGDSKDTDGIIRSVGVGPRHAPSLRRSAGRRGRSQAAYDPKALFAFHPSNASLFDIHAVGNQIISTSLDAFLGDPSSCHRLVSKLRDLGRSCQTGSIPQHWFSEILASVAAFSRTLKWYQAVRDSEEGDHTGWNFFVSWQESSPEHAPNSPESIKDFPIVSTLSRRVFIAQRTSTPDTFVVKVVPKRVMFSKNKITLIRDKRMAIYNRTDSYFVNKIYFTFQSKSNVYLVKELHRQGNCVALIRNSLGRVGEVAARNFVVQLVDGLEHLHDAGIIHRDLRPEHVLIDDNQRLKLTDFGLSQREFLGRNLSNSIRTALYLTPEAVLGLQDDDASIDWWALGIMAHEFLCGSTPFETPNVEEALLKIISGKIDWKWETAPSLAARRFIEALLCPDVRRRLGCTVNAAQGIKNHEFISCIPPPVLPTTVAFGKNLANYTPPTSPGSRSSSSRPSKSRKNSKDSPTLLSAYSRQSSQESIAPPRGRRGRSRSRSARSRSRRRNSSNASFGSSWLSGYTTDSASDLEHESDEDSSFASAGPSTRSSLWDWTIPSTRSSECRPDEEYLDLTDKVAELDRYPFESGSVADIYKAELTATKLPVAVKIFRRMHYERETFEKTSKYLYQEARIWQQLEHPNILPFLGIASNLGRSPALISPLCVSGPIMKHLQHKKKDQHERLQMIIGVAEGLAYLHSQGIVHGNLCTKKILVDAGGSPVICGYGMSKALRQPASSATTSLFSSPTRFAPPESFVAKGSSLARSDSGDVYSFSMIVLEILSGLPPYHDLGSEQAVFIHVVRGGRPSRTQDIVISNDVWRFLTWVWNESPPSRPGMPDIILSLLSFREKNLHGSVELRELAAERASILSSGSEASPSLGVRFNSPALHEAILNNLNSKDIALPEVIDNVNGRDLKGRVRQVDQYPFAGGANSNVYRGKLTRSNGRKIRVAIKMLRVSDDGSGQMEEISRRLKRQVDLWAGLKHQNVLPFFGVCDDIAPWPVLVSPFYKLGHIGTYVRMNPAANREELACGVASGLQYLHGREIVHGDLKVQNVLVDKRGSPCICDFGISKIIGHRGFTTCSVGTAPYMAPELFLVLDAPPASMQSSPSTTKSSDVYSFGLLVLEILTCQPPKGRPSRPIVTAEVLADLRPKRADYDEELVKEESWVVLDRCWNSNPDQRPEIVEVHQRLARSFRKTKWLL